jgi:hypothetical protein
MDMIKIDPINYLAIDLLEQLGNVEPNSEKIDQIEELIKEKLRQLLINLKS